MNQIESLLDQIGQNSGYVRELYQQFLIDPSLVGDEWAHYFRSLLGQTNGHTTNGHAASSQSLDTGGTLSVKLESQQVVFEIIEAYRSWGHLHANINPLTAGVKLPPRIALLEQPLQRFSEADRNSNFLCAGFRSQTSSNLSSLISELEAVYCGSIGFEYKHLVSLQQREWLQEAIENRQQDLNFTKQQKLGFLSSLISAEGLESELHKTYVGAKRFSLQGGESTLPMLECLLDGGARRGVKHVIIGMAHRGRLNVLTHICGKPYEVLCSEFDDQSIASVVGAGDVKYHLGYTNTRKTLTGAEIRVELAPNPSHLEFVNPVVGGLARAFQDHAHGSERATVLPIQIHGDAAFIGQGIVWETLNMSAVDGYRTGGSVHLVINNQVGFTTNPEESRSAIYCSDMAKAVMAPVFHINGDDVESACWAASLALEFRQKFGVDVVLDLYCYRKYGHNEGDDPTFTQPALYAELQNKKSVATLYAEELIKQGHLTAEEFDALKKAFSEKFQNARAAKQPLLIGDACPTHGKLRVNPKPSAVSIEMLQRVANTLVSYPEGFTAHVKLQKILEKRVNSLTDGQGIDWGFAEGLAFGSLVCQGVGVRLSGQDAGRGTFSQRHLLLTDIVNGNRYIPFSQLASSHETRFEVYNSVLSENSVMGFEFGYASVASKSLVLWEAQFGDFANGAQVIIDQFLASSEAKWNQLSGLVLMLPHGFEGQGPEHSSARLERYLQLCAEGNLTVAHPSTANQHFHLLRRQGLMEIKRPLIIMTPKSLLRSPLASCQVDRLTSGSFEPAIATDFGPNKASSVVFCSGKVYYDVASALEKAKSKSVRVIRLEQLYPFPREDIRKLVTDIKPKCVSWVQEEPQNMGAWSYVAPLLKDECNLSAQYFGRASSASPATGSAKHSALELQQFISELLDVC